MLKKFFKSPEELSALTRKDLSAALKKIFAKGIEGTQFFLKGEFAYAVDADDEEDKNAKASTAPVLYVGPSGGKWKAFAKKHKAAGDFAMGYCKTEINPETKETRLLLEVTSGKGGKETILKEINKKILAKANATAVFATGLKINTVKDDKEGIEDTESEAVENETDDESVEVTPKQMAFDFKGLFETYKGLRDGEYSENDVEDLMEGLKEWNDNFKLLDPKGKQALKNMAGNFTKMVEGAKKMKQIDASIQSKTTELTKIVQAYLMLADHKSKEAQDLHVKADAILSDLKKAGTFMNSKSLLAECAALEAALDS